jgi:hypothetical protein
MAKVYSTNVQGRVLFEAPDRTAQKWVENNFPRVHVDAANAVEDPQPDVYVLLNSGSKTQYNGEEWVPLAGPKTGAK